MSIDETRTRIEELWQQYKPQVWAQILDKIPPRDAEDVFQEVGLAFCKAMVKAGLARQLRLLAPGGYLRRITRNKIHDYFNKTQNRNPHQELEEPDQRAGRVGDRDASITVAQAARAAALTELEARVLNFRHTEKMGFMEIGTHIGKTEKAAQHIHKKALEKMKKAIS